MVGVVVNVNKDRMQIDLSLKPSLLAKPESWWIANRSNERFLDEWFKKPTTNILTPIPTIGKCCLVDSYVRKTFL